MLRRRFVIAAAASLLLCATMLAIWSRSNGRDFWLQTSVVNNTFALKVRGGLVSFYRAYPGGGYLRPPKTLAETPIYYPILVCAFCTYLLALHAYRPRKQNTGRCESCGYDLRATPDRCPECGRVPEADVVERKHN